MMFDVTRLDVFKSYLADVLFSAKYLRCLWERRDSEVYNSAILRSPSVTVLLSLTHRILFHSLPYPSPIDLFLYNYILLHTFRRVESPNPFSFLPIYNPPIHLSGKTPPFIANPLDCSRNCSLGLPFPHTIHPITVHARFQLAAVQQTVLTLLGQNE